MRFFELCKYSAEQALKGVLLKAIFAVIVLLLIALSLVPRLPLPEVVISISLVMGYAYFITATAGNIIEKTDRHMIELFLSKPVTRRDIILADFAGTVTAVSLSLMVLSVGLWVLYGLRLSVWDVKFLSLSASMILGFGAMYSFMILMGVAIRNSSVIILVWVGYAYIGALVLENRSEVIYTKMPSTIYKVIIDGVYYILPPIYSIQKVFSRLSFDNIQNFLPIIIPIISTACALTCAIIILGRKEPE